MFLTNFKWNYYNVPFGFGYACFMCRLYSIYTVTVYLKTAMYLAWDKVWLFFSEDRLATLWNSRAHFTQVKLHYCLVGISNFFKFYYLYSQPLLTDSLQFM